MQILVCLFERARFHRLGICKWLFTYGMELVTERDHPLNTYQVWHT